MPKEVYECCLTGDVFETKEEAIKSEEKASWDVIRSEFPSRNSGDSKYNRYCVDTNELLLSFDRDFDGHRNEVGKCIKNNPKETLLRGLRCPAAHIEAVIKLAKIIKFWKTAHIKVRERAILNSV